MRRTLYLAWGMLLTTALHAQINCNTETFFRTFGSPTTSEVGLTLCPSGDGNLYASGIQDAQTVLLKLSPTGDVLWSRAFALNTQTPCVINEMFVDAAGMLVAAGIETDTATIATSLAFRYDPVANAMMWIKRFEGDSVFANGIIEKSPGGNYIFYQNTISLGTLSARAEVVELNRQTGAIMPSLARRYSLNNAAEFTRMVSYEGALYSIGTAQTLPIPIPSFRPLLTRLDSANAQPVWSRLTYISTTPTDLIGLDLLIDNDTILSLTGGAFLGIGTPTDIHLYLQKNTLNGDLVWMKKYEIPAFASEFGAEIVKLGDGYAIYGAGQQDSTVSQLMLKLDHDGNVVAAKTLGNTDQSALLPFLKGEAIAFNNQLFFSGTTGLTSTDWSILKTDSELTLTDSCGYLQNLDSVTATISPNPLNIPTTLNTSGGAVTTHDTTANISNITLTSVLLCPICADSCSLVLDLGPDLIFCHDTTITVNAGPGFLSYLWNDGTTTSTVQVMLDSSSVSVSVTVIDSCGVTQRDTINFTVITDVPSIADYIICPGDSVNLNFPTLAGSEFVSDTTLAFDSLGVIVLSPDTTTTYTLFVSTVDGCARLDTFQITVTNLLPVTDTLLACTGDVIVIDSISYTQNTTVVDTLHSNTGSCDTLRTLQLIFNLQPIYTDTIVLCAGGSILFEGVIYTQDTTIIQDTLTASGSGCDTLLGTTFVFEPLSTSTDTIQLCQGDMISFNGIFFSQDTSVVDTLLSFPNGCDSLANHVLIFNPRTILSDTLQACQGDSITFGGLTYFQDTTLVDTLASSTGGCDTLQTTQLVFTPQPTLTSTITACAGDTIQLDGNIYFQNTTVIDTLASTTGSCDTLRTRILVFTPVPTLNDTLTACIGDFILIDSISYTQDTTLTDILNSTTGGCDTVRTLQLVFTPVPTQTVTLGACAGSSIQVDGIFYTQDTSIVVMVQSNTGGCDTVRTLVLTFTPLPMLNSTLSACTGDVIVVGGVSYTQNATVIDTVPSATGGCDTLRTVQLVFNQQPIYTDTIVLCAGGSILFEGVTYTQDTTIFQDTLTASGFGCDTLLGTTFVFEPLHTSTDTIQLCQGDMISFNGVFFSQDTSVVDTLLSFPNGCDSLATHLLIFKPRPTVTNTLQACPGDSIIFGGVTYFQDTIFVDTLASTTGGCDTIVTNSLTFSQPTLTDTIQFAPGDTVFVNGVPYTFPVIVVDTLLSTTGGCDTIATYVLQYLTPFTITCQPDITVTAPVGEVGTIVDYNLPTVTTSCPGGFSTFTLLSGLPVGAVFPIGVTQVCIQATDSCGNTDTCCFNVTVLGGQQACDVKQNGCFRWELLPIKLDSLGQRRYQIKVTNNCALKVNYVLFQLPNGVVAVAPADNSIYTDATSNRKYLVRNPNFSPFYSVRFKTEPGTVLNNGAFDLLEYKLPQQSQPSYIHTLVKFEDGSTLEAHLNTFNCPILPFPNFTSNPVDERGQLNGQDLSLYPNPSGGDLLFDLAAWENQALQIEVINAQGRLVQTMKTTAEAGLQSLHLDDHLPNGLYHLVVRPNEGIPVAEPFILERN